MKPITVTNSIATLTAKPEIVASESDKQLWKNYCDATDATAIYPEANTGSDIELAYLTMGLIGEIGEVGEIVAKETCGVVHGDLFAELGDCFWYLARLSKLSEFWLGKPVLPTPHAWISATYAESIGALANSAKKVIRDQCNPSKFLAHVQTTADDLATLYKVEAQADDFWPALNADILQKNLDKLSSRAARNTLKGDGDNR